MKSKIVRKTDIGLLKFKSVTAVTSKTVADALGVSHRNLMRNVEKAKKLQSEIRSDVSTSFNPVFQDYTYQDTQNRTQSCKLMNEDAVKALIKVVDTQEAYNYFAQLMDEFNKMKLEREARMEVKSPTKTLNRLLKILQRKLDKELPLKESGKKSAKISMIYNHIQTAINKTVTGIGKSVDRNTLTKQQLEEMDFLEREFANRIIMNNEFGFSSLHIRDDLMRLADYIQAYEAENGE